MGKIIKKSIVIVAILIVIAAITTYFLHNSKYSIHSISDDNISIIVGGNRVNIELPENFIKKKIGGVGPTKMYIDKYFFDYPILGDVDIIIALELNKKDINEENGVYYYIIQPGKCNEESFNSAYKEHLYRMYQNYNNKDEKLDKLLNQSEKSINIVQEKMGIIKDISFLHDVDSYFDAKGNFSSRWPHSYMAIINDSKNFISQVSINYEVDGGINVRIITEVCINNRAFTIIFATYTKNMQGIHNIMNEFNRYVADKLLGKI